MDWILIWEDHYGILHLTRLTTSEEVEKFLDRNGLNGDTGVLIFPPEASVLSFNPVPRYEVKKTAKTEEMKEPTREKEQKNNKLKKYRNYRPEYVRKRRD